MKTFFTLSLHLAFVYSISCGLVPSFSAVKEDMRRLNDSVTNASFSIFVQQNHTMTAALQVTLVDDFTIVDDQLVVPRAVLANSSDIQLSDKYKAIVSNTSAEATMTVTTTGSTPASAEDGKVNDKIKEVQNEIVVPKGAIDNSTLASTVLTTSPPLASTSSVNSSIENAMVVPKTAITNNYSLSTGNESETRSTKVSPTIIASDQNATTIENVIVVPKASIVNSSNSAAINESEIRSTNVTPANALDTVEPNQAGLGPISVHKRSVNSSSEDYPDTSSALFEKYDKWTGPGAITSQEVRELKKKGLWFEQTTRPDKPYNRTRRKRREAMKYDWLDDTSLQVERGSEEESSEDDKSFQDNLKGAFESSSHENVTASTDSSPSNNVSDTTALENLGNVHQQHLKEDVVDEDDSVCAVNKDDEEATRVVTIFWRSVFCVIFVIIVVYPIYSYTKIYCLKRRKYAESISNERFVGSDSELSNTTTNDCPIPTTPTATAK